MIQEGQGHFFKLYSNLIVVLVTKSGIFAFAIGIATEAPSDAQVDGMLYSNNPFASCGSGSFNMNA
jgi:hypothetical protein